MIVKEKCKCNEELLELVNRCIAEQGSNFLHSNIYGIKKNFSQRKFDRFLEYKDIITKSLCCIEKSTYNKIIEKIKTEL